MGHGMQTKPILVIVAAVPSSAILYDIVINEAPGLPEAPSNYTLLPGCPSSANQRTADGLRNQRACFRSQFLGLVQLVRGFRPVVDSH